MNEEPDRTAYGGAAPLGRGAGEVRNVARHVEGTAVQIGTVGGDVYVGGAVCRERGVPLVVTVQQPVDSFVTPLDAAPAGRTPLSPEPSPSTIEDWSESLTVLIEGRSAQAVILTALRPVVLARRPPRPMRIMGCSRPILEPRRFVVDLGRASVRLHAGPGPNFPFTVTASDPEQFGIDLQLHDPVEVDWIMELDWICAGRTGTVRIPDTGHYTHFPLLE